MRFLPGEASAGRLWRAFQGATAIWIGLGYAIGPPFFYRSPTLFVLQELPVPIPLWGWIMALAGVLVLSPLRPVGHFLALAVFGFWSSCIAVNAIANLISYFWFTITGNYLDGTPPIASWGADALFLTVALLHAHQLLAPLQDKKDSPVDQDDGEVT